MNLAVALANARDLDGWAREAGAPDDLDRGALLELRQWVRDALETVAGGGRPPRPCVEALNRASAGGPTYARLEHGGLVYVTLASPGEAFVADVAAETIKLVGGPDRPLVRRCEAPGCNRIFVASRPRQRWCSDRCGVRARVARHRAA